MAEWRPIATAPFASDLELSVITDDDIHALVFPCRRALYGWINSKTGAAVDIHPSHWREWNDRGSLPGDRLQPAT